MGDYGDYYEECILISGGYNIRLVHTRFVHPDCNKDRRVGTHFIFLHPNLRCALGQDFCGAPYVEGITGNTQFKNVIINLKSQIVRCITDKNTLLYTFDYN